MTEAQGEIVVTDIDNDGIPDVVSVSKEGPMWYRNLGNGIFDEVRSLSSVGVAQTPIAQNLTSTTAVQASDVTGDGFPEIIIASADGDVICYLNSGGSFNGNNVIVGSWLPEGVADPPDPISIRTVDVNGDGDIDIVLAHRIYGIKCYDNLGDGTFGPVRQLASGGSWLNSMELADMNVDGMVDLVHAGDNTGDHVALNLNTGNGEFGPTIFIAAVATDPVSVQIADVNNDGFPDVGVNNAIDGTVRIYLNNGSGNFPTSVVALSAAGSLRRIKLADVTGDGNIDLLYGHSLTSVSCMAGNGAGGFAAPAVLTDGLNRPDHLAVHDMDGDGDPDLISSGDPMSLFLNDGSTGDWEQREIARPFVVGTAVGDVDNDGDNDVLCWYGGPKGGLFLLTNNGSGFDPLQYIYKGLDDPADAYLTDLDNDGILDIAFITRGLWTGSDQVLVGKGLGDGSWLPFEVVLSPYSVFSLKVGDVNEDGAAELMIVYKIVQSGGYDLRVKMNNGNGTFASNATMLTWMQACMIADMDGDGANDVAWVYFDKLQWRSYTGSTWSTQQEIVIPEEDMHPTFLDVDDDGKGDIVLSGTEQVWLKGNGDGTYGEPTTLFISEPFAKLHAEDMDNDGMTDLVVMRTNGLVWYRNVGQGVFEQEERLILIADGIEDGAHTHEINGISVADIDGDGAKDVIVQYPRTVTGDRVSYLSNPNGAAYLSGRIYVELDGVPGFSAMDAPLQYFPVTTTSQVIQPYSNSMGRYSFCPGPGTFVLGMAQDVIPGSFQISAPIAEMYNVELDSVSHRDLDFVYTSTVDTSLISINWVEGSGACGNVVPWWLHFRNDGTRLEQGTITVTLDSLYTFQGSTPQPQNVNGQVIEWDLSLLNIMENRSIRVDVVSPTGSANGTPFTHHASITTIAADSTVTGEFASSFASVVACSYDPNDKRSEPVGFGEFHAIDVNTAHIDFTIRFQNTGTAPAYTVEITDALHAQIDRERVQLIAYTHQPTSMWIDEQNILSVRFEQIMLPDSASDPTGSQGAITLRAGLYPGEHLTAITNTAEIYFDLNPPVLTNSTLNTLIDCDQWQPAISGVSDTSLIVDGGLEYIWYLNGEVLAGQDMQELTPLVTGIYSALVTSVHGCISMTEPHQVLLSALDEVNSISILVFPNPMTTMAKIVMDQPLSPEDRIVVIEPLGRVVASYTGNGTNELIIHRGQLASGVYWIDVMLRNDRIRIPMVIQ